MFVFPAHLWNPSKVRAKIGRATLSGGTNLVGDEDVVITDGGGRWEIEYGDITLDDEMNNLWEAWNGYLAAGVTEVLVPLLSLELAPRPSLGSRRMQPSALVYDDPVFPTYVRFAAPFIEAYAATAVPLRATQITIDTARGAPIRGGEKFSVGERAYRIGRRVMGDIWSIEPPVRVAFASGTALNFDWPVVRCRSTPGEDWSPEIMIGRFADAAIVFRESF